jgi:hypothetical protein
VPARQVPVDADGLQRALEPLGRDGRLPMPGLPRSVYSGPTVLVHLVLKNLSALMSNFKRLYLWCASKLRHHCAFCRGTFN